MEFGIDQLQTGLRPGSSRFELSRRRALLLCRSELFFSSMLLSAVVSGVFVFPIDYIPLEWWPKIGTVFCMP